MDKFWCDYVQAKYGQNAKPCYMDTNSFILHVKTDYINNDIAEVVKTRFDISNFDLEKPLPKGKVIGLMEDELVGETIKEFVGLRARTYSYLKDNNDEDKKKPGVSSKETLNLNIIKTV